MSYICAELNNVNVQYQRAQYFEIQTTGLSTQKAYYCQHDIRALCSQKNITYNLLKNEIKCSVITSMRLNGVSVK